MALTDWSLGNIMLQPQFKIRSQSAEAVRYSDFIPAAESDILHRVTCGWGSSPGSIVNVEYLVNVISHGSTLTWTGSTN